MKRRSSQPTYFFFIVASLAAVLFTQQPGRADPSKYPQFAQQSPPANFLLISVDELVDEVKAGKKPMIIDVRTVEEFHEVHILGAVSAPLAEFKDYVKSIPRDRPVVLTRA